MTVPARLRYPRSVAVLCAQTSGQSITLPDRCLVGRSRACDVVLTARDVSGQHAVLQWTGLHWQLQELGSRNGTHIDGSPVPIGKRVIVAQGSRIRFGREETWTLTDAGPPQLMAVRADTGEVRLAEGGLLALPDAHEPVATIYQDPHGAWVCERHGEPAILDDRTVVPVADVAWKIYLPTACQATSQDESGILHLGLLRLRLSFSRDEEHIEVVAFAGERRFELQTRAHNYMLLVLARRRLADRDAGVAEDKQGWIRQDELLRMLRIDENHLNISVHRARAQLARIGVTDAASLIERKPGARQIRLGIRELEVVPQHDDR